MRWASRQFILFFGGAQSSASGSAPGGDAPTLNFSSATNSQYVALIFGGYWGV